jgi:hypothetical protein
MIELGMRQQGAEGDLCLLDKRARRGVDAPSVQDMELLLEADRAADGVSARLASRSGTVGLSAGLTSCSVRQKVQTLTS